MAKKKRDDNFFWIGYSDLMTTLFFVMLVLFTIVFISANPSHTSRLERENLRLKKEIADLEKRINELQDTVGSLVVEKQKLENIIQIEKQFETLQEDSDFEFLPECNKYVAKNLKGIELFESDRSNIKTEYHKDVLIAGQKIKSFVKDLNNKKNDFSYLLVIEGNTANWPQGSANYRDKNDRNGFKLSYDRAWALYDYWERNGISFREDNVEVIISGSGFNGICRDSNEPNNKRFSIQIIPKVAPMISKDKE